MDMDMHINIFESSTFGQKVENTQTQTRFHIKRGKPSKREGLETPENFKIIKNYSKITKIRYTFFLLILPHFQHFCSKKPKIFTIFNSSKFIEISKKKAFIDIKKGILTSIHIHTQSFSETNICKNYRKFLYTATMYVHNAVRTHAKIKSLYAPNLHVHACIRI